MNILVYFDVQVKIFKLGFSTVIGGNNEFVGQHLSFDIIAKGSNGSISLSIGSNGHTNAVGNLKSAIFT